jgi:cytochrome b involved in lipid metabolism
MLSKKSYLLLAVVVIFMMGAGYIVYRGRPVVTLNQVPNTKEEAPSTTHSIATSPSPTSPTSTQNPTPAPTPGIYTIADVQKHATKESCWSVVDGNVYDLTTWIDRHPGGAQAILGMCGTDGSAAYHGQHGNARRPASLLVLLKIGALR